MNERIKTMNAKDECEALLNALLPAVQHLLEINHRFYPVGAVMKTDDTIVHTVIYDENEHPDSQSIINSLTAAHRQSAVKGELKVSGIVFDAAVVVSCRKTDAIMINLEHQSGYSVTIGLPYAITLFKKVKYGALFAQEGSHNIF